MTAKYGLELEFGSTVPDYELANWLDVELEINKEQYQPNSEWLLGEDQSADSFPFIGLEIKSPIFTKLPTRGSLEFITRRLSAKCCAPTPTSGLHFHFSGDAYASLKTCDIRELSRRLFMIAGVKPVRVKYCDYTKSHTEKHGALRYIEGDHWECRVFNSTFDVGEIEDNFKKMKKIIGEYI